MIIHHLSQNVTRLPPQAATASVFVARTHEQRRASMERPVAIDNDKIAVQEAKPALIDDLAPLQYLSPAAASTILWSAERLRRGDTEVVSAHVDSSTHRHFAERERIRRCEAEEVRGRRAQLHELRQKLDAHHTGREAMKRQLLEKIERDIELVGLSCGRQMTREAEEAIRSQLAAVSAAVAAHCQQSDAADEVRLRWLG